MLLAYLFLFWWLSGLLVFSVEKLERMLPRLVEMEQYASTIDDYVSITQALAKLDERDRTVLVEHMQYGPPPRGQPTRVGVRRAKFYALRTEAIKRLLLLLEGPQSAETS